MSTPPAVNHLLANHTFGREHSNPPPLPQNIQMGQLIGAGQAGADDSPNVQAHDGGLPHDLDYLVHSVGEW